MSREEAKNPGGPCTVHVCLNHRDPAMGRPSCYERGSLALKRELEKLLAGKVEVRPATCMGCCDRGPTVRIETASGERLLVRSDAATVLIELGIKPAQDGASPGST